MEVKRLLFLAVLALCCFVGASSSPGKQGDSVSGCWLLTVVPSVVGKHRLWAHRLQAVVVHAFSCSAASGIFSDYGSNPCPLHHRWILIYCATREVTLRCLWKEGNCEGRKVCKLRCLNSQILVAQMVKSLPTMRETQVRSLGWEDPLEKEMATHSSTFAWKIPWKEEPGRL